MIPPKHRLDSPAAARPALPPLRTALAVSLVIWAGLSLVSCYAFLRDASGALTPARALWWGASDQATWALVSLSGYGAAWWAASPTRRPARTALLLVAAGIAVVTVRFLLMRTAGLALLPDRPAGYALLSTGPYHLLLFLTSAAGGLATRSYAAATAVGLQTADLRRRLTETRLQLLQSQLHPHFLFNTLNSVATLLHRSPAEASRMLDGLAGILEESFGGSPDQFHTVADELALVELYLGIEQQRFGQRLVIRRQVDATLLDAPLPRFLLQVLVENAVRHGAAARRGRAEIVVTLGCEDEWLCLAVQDNGPGLPPGWSLEGAPGLGLRNSAARIRDLYDASAQFDVSPRPGGGTIARIRVPLLTEGGN